MVVYRRQGRLEPSRLGSFSPDLLVFQSWVSDVGVELKLCTTVEPCRHSELLSPPPFSGLVSSSALSFLSISFSLFLSPFYTLHLFQPSQHLHSCQLSLSKQRSSSPGIEKEKMGSSTIQVLMVLALFTTSCIAQAPGAAPTVSPPTATPPTPVAAPPSPTPTPTPVPTPSPTPTATPSPSPSPTTPTSPAPSPTTASPPAPPPTMGPNADGSSIPPAADVPPSASAGFNRFVIAGTALAGIFIAVSFF